MIKKLITTSTLVLATMFGATSAQSLYQEITPAVPAIFDPNKIEVVEIFSYACPACNTFEPYISKWIEAQKEVDDIKVIPLAAPGQGVWTLYAQVFYTLEAMNELDRGHKAFFNAVHKEGKRFINQNQIADYMAQQGIDRDKFLKAWNGFSAKSSFNRGTELINSQYQVPFTPAIIVDGRYVLSANDAQSRPGNENPYEKLILTIDDVVQKVRDERSAKAQTLEETTEAQ